MHKVYLFCRHQNIGLIYGCAIVFVFPRAGALDSGAERVNDELWRQGGPTWSEYILSPTAHYWLLNIQANIFRQNWHWIKAFSLNLSSANSRESRYKSSFFTSDIVFPVLLAKVGEGHRVLDVDSELLRVTKDGLIQGQQLVILHLRRKNKFWLSFGLFLSVFITGHQAEISQKCRPSDEEGTQEPEGLWIKVFLFFFL